MWSAKIYHYQIVKNNIHCHHNLGEMVRISEQESIFLSFLAKSIFFSLSYFLPILPGSRIKEINPGIIVWCYFSFLFHQRAFGNFHFRHRDRFA